MWRAGATRMVCVGRKLVFKFPYFLSYRQFLYGLLANMQEVQWSRWTKDERLCPVVFWLPLGLLVVMKKAEVMSEDYEPSPEVWQGLPFDAHWRNFGVLGGRVVMIDYGS